MNPALPKNRSPVSNGGSGPVISAAVGTLFVFHERDVTDVITLERDDHRIVLDDDRVIPGIASAFLLKHDSQLYLVTCKHCVSFTITSETRTVRPISTRSIATICWAASIAASTPMVTR